MEWRPFGWTGEQVAVVGQGTWKLPRGRRSVQALRLGLDLGMTHVDAAEMYANEEVVGEAIAGRRKEVFLASKVLPSHASRTGTRNACEQSLRRLGTDHLDLYLLHWRGSIPIEETMAAMEDLVERGLTRYIGVSNFDVHELEEAQRALTKQKIVSNQVLYHLEDRGIERKLIPYCAKHGIAIVAYSPFGHDSFPGPHTPGGRLLKQIGARYGKTPHQVALRFLTRYDNVFVIPKAARTEHVIENSGGVGWQLSKEDIALIDEAFPAPDHDVPLGMI